MQVPFVLFLLRVSTGILCDPRSNVTGLLIIAMAQGCSERQRVGKRDGLKTDEVGENIHGSAALLLGSF